LDKVSVLRGRISTVERLKQMMMRIDEAGQDDVTGEIYGLIGCIKTRVGASDRLYYAVADEDGAIGDLALAIVHRYEDAGIADKNGAHDADSPELHRLIEASSRCICIAVSKPLAELAR
jgi:hypothetical protein